MEPAVAEAVEMGLEPQLRARSNTWPAVPRLADDFGDSGGSSGGGAGGGLLGGQDMKGPPPPVGPIPAHLKKNSSRRNAWGNLSYADLITQAIGSAPDKRLTLAQIYEWMVHNVAYFKDKGDSNSSAGWKNSIRHNLSLHNRFMRVQNEGTGKSSWWMINPDAKPGKSARRRATSMETSKFEKRRGRVKKKVEALRSGLDATPSPSSSVSESLDLFPESPLHGFQLSPDFRPRTSSNASSCGGRLSPIPAVEPDWGYYGPEQLAGNLEQTMRLGQQQQASPNSQQSSQPPQPQSQQQIVGVAAVSGPANGGPPGSGGGNGGGGVAASQGRGSGGPATPELPPSAFIYPQPPPPPYRPAPPYSSITQCPIHRNHTHSCPTSCPIAPKQRINYMEGADQSAATMMGQLMGALNPSMLDDLNINIETIPGFDCNVDEVIKHELSLEGSLDFNFSAGGQPPSGSHQPSHTQEQASPFSGHPWVH